MKIAYETLKKLCEKGTNNDIQRILKQIGNFLNHNEENFVPNLEQFREFMIKFQISHLKCRSNCSHLKRFYQKLGITKFKRKLFSLKKSIISEKL